MSHAPTKRSLSLAYALTDRTFRNNIIDNKLNKKLNELGWKLRYAQIDEFNGDFFWNYEKKIDEEFVGLDVFIGE